MRLMYWLIVAATAAVYAAMALWSLPMIAGEAGGLAPFDLRPLGYSEAEARAFLDRLSAEGRDHYLTVQRRLDLAFPALLAAALAWTALRLPPRGWHAVRWLVVAGAIGGMVADYAENAAVATMLATSPDAVTGETIAAASRWTRLKTLGATVALSLGVILLVRAVVVRMQSTRATDSNQ